MILMASFSMSLSISQKGLLVPIVNSEKPRLYGTTNMQVVKCSLSPLQLLHCLSGCPFPHLTYLHSLPAVVDVEFGRLQARDMLQHLWTGPISNASVDVVQGGRSVEVRAVGVTKVSAHAHYCMQVTPVAMK